LATLNTSTIINNGGGITTLTVSGGTNIFNGQIVDSTTGGGQVALAVINGANQTLFANQNAAAVIINPNTFSGGITVSNATLQVGSVASTTASIVGSDTLGGNPPGTQNILMVGTNAALFLAGAAGSQTPTINTTVGNLTIPTGSTATITSPNRGTFTSTLLGAGTLNFKVNIVQRLVMGGDWSGFTGTINFYAVNNGNTITFNASTLGLPNASVFMQPTNNSGVVTINTVTSGSVFPIGALSGGDNTSALTGAVGSNGNGGQPSIFAIGGLNTSTTFGGIIQDALVGIRKVGTGTLTLTNATLSYTGQTVVSNGVLAIAPIVATPVVTAQAASFLASSNFTLVSPGILDVTAASGTLYLGHAGLVQSISGNGTLNGSLQVTNGTVIPGLRAGQAGFTTGSSLHVNGSVTMYTASTNILTINRTNSTPNDNLTASSIVYNGVLIVTNVGDTAFPGQTTNTFQLFSGAISGTFASVTLPVLPAGEYWITNLPAGTISLANTNSAIVNTPTPILVSVTGGILSLSWAPDHLGWWLQAQTNTLGKGLGTNWVDIANSNTSTNSTITPDPTQPTVFYRLSQLP
jgi:autotransporter-associated beta strand protein